MAGKPRNDAVAKLRLAQGKSVSKRAAAPPQDAEVARRPGIVRTETRLSIDLSEIETKDLLSAQQTPRSLQAAVVALRIKGMTIGEIATATGIDAKVIRRALYEAKQNAPVADLDVLIDARGLPQAVDNMLDLLDRGDKEATFEVLRGRGVLRTHQAVRHEGGTGNLTLNVAFNLPANAKAEPISVAGQVFGKPRIGSGDAPE